jgi:glycine cleavage system transcriptional repressor
MSRKDLVLLTAVGEDQPGIVERVTRKIVEHAGNVQQSRMARLGGEFAAFLLVSLSAQETEVMRREAQGLCTDRLSVTCRVVPERSRAVENLVPYTLHVRGADHEGIIHEFCQLLAGKGINIAEMTTDVAHSPVSGTPIFSMDATLEAPPPLPLKELRQWITDLADQLVVDATLHVSGLPPEH